MAMKIIPEIMLKIFKKISDEDVKFMGFSPIWSRPEWMICQVLAVPPPQVRPSIKHDAQQRSEDDLTHIMVNIMKINKNKITGKLKVCLIKMEFKITDQLLLVFRRVVVLEI
jgi:DNA-directed RNA polymerase beta' subunit